jgi:hypothetical protein
MTKVCSISGCLCIGKVAPGSHFSPGRSSRPSTCRPKGRSSTWRGRRRLRWRGRWPGLRQRRSLRAGEVAVHLIALTADLRRGHGTLTLFAALNYLEGKLITRLAARHRHQEWLAFLKTIDEPRAISPSTSSPTITPTHKHPAVTRWLDRHARFHMHYTPTSSSWMNLVERFFRDLTEFITEKSFASTRELADAIIAFLAARNDNPRRYVWKAKGEDIDAARQALAALQPTS